MASIKANKSSSGKIISYRWRACTGRDDYGRQQFISKTVKVDGRYAGFTPKKLEAAMQLAADTWEKEVASGEISVAKDTLRDFVNNVWLPLQVNDGQHRPNTVVYYTEAARPVVSAMGDMKLTDITQIDVQKYLRSLSNHETVATVIRQYRIMRMIFKYAYNMDVVSRNVMDKVSPPAKRSKGNIEVLTQEQAIALIDAVNQYATPFWKTFIMLLLTSGLRRGEALGLQWRDIDFRAGTLTVERNVTNVKSEITIGEPKTEKACRTLPIPKSMETILSAWRAEQAKEYGTLLPTAYLFNTPEDPFKPITPLATTRWLARFTHAHGLEPCHPHELRHTAATIMLASGASIKEVQEALGHTDAAVTLNYYTASTPETLRKAVDGLAEALKIAP